METVVNNVFQVDSNIVQSARSLDNYLIIKDDKKAKEQKEICAVYFASNYIYYPNKAESFKKSICDKNRFEWYNLRHPKATKHIFIRDVYKQWYLHGINNELNSIEKLEDFLKEETKGYTSYFIGSSAGGYAAVLLGAMVNADRVYNFNGQFFLTDLLKNSKAAVDPLIFREQNNREINKYYHIKPYILNPEKVYYFHSNKSDWDIEQYKAVADLEINVININTNIHGIPLLKNNLVSLFAMEEKELNVLTSKKLNPIAFSIKIIGFRKTTSFLFKIIPNAYKRWVYNPIYNFLKRN